MDAYKYDRSPYKRRIRHGLVVLAITTIIIAGIVGVLALANRHKKSHLPLQGTTIYVPQTSQSLSTISFDEPTFTLQLPNDWKQVSKQAHSISWQATLKNADNRSLTVYTDVIPTSQPVSRELPITVSGNQLTPGDQSDDCINFTAGGTSNVAVADQLKPAASVWDGVNFICDLPRGANNQVVGTGSLGSPVNTFTVTGPTAGTHSYFFYYEDLNIQPDYNILYTALQSFRAK